MFLFYDSRKTEHVKISGTVSGLNVLFFKFSLNTSVFLWLSVLHKTGILSIHIVANKNRIST